MPRMIDIVTDYLKANGYDGLCNPEIECGCFLNDLMPCGDNCMDCQPGHRGMIDGLEACVTDDDMPRASPQRRSTTDGFQRRTSMAQYRKRPVVIEAHQWHKNGDHPEDDVTRGGTTPNGEVWEGLVVRYFRRPDVNGNRTCEKCGDIMHNHGWIDTLEGGHVVCPGDWIITGVAGEHYPCKPEIFAATYEAV